MSSKVAIVDYGLGNLFSINQACEYVGLDSTITNDPQIISSADALILPGVGAFGDAMGSLEDNNLIEPLLTFVQTGKPFLGICLGMQLLFNQSNEFGNHQGLNLIEGQIKRFPIKDEKGQINRVPQIQWNQIYMNSEDLWNDSPLKNIEDGAYMQFVHSYYAEPKHQDVILSYTEYGGIRYASSVKKNNIIGIQFHPEKSAEQGLHIYGSWANFINKKSY